MQAPHTASAAAARNVAPLPTTTSAAEAFAKIVWRQAPVPAASGDPRDVLQRTFASLQVRFADEAGGSDPTSAGDPSGALACLHSSAALSAKSAKSDPHPASGKLAHDLPQRAPRAPAAMTHDLPLCCSPTCRSKLCRGCPEEHAAPNWSADSDYDSETASDDEEDGEDDA